MPGKAVGQSCNTCYTGDRFGDTVAVGDVNGDGRDDVAIRSRKKYGTKDYWTLSTTVLLAGGGKYTPFSRSQQFNDKHYAPAPAWLNTLLIARLGTDRYAELVTGRPNGNGSVIIRRGTKTGAAKATTTLTQATKGVAGSPELGDRFGVALAAIPVQKCGRLNLVVGIPGEWVTPGPRPRNRQKEQGQITQFGLGAALPTGTGSTTYIENSAGIAGSASDAPGGLGRLLGRGRRRGHRGEPRPGGSGRGGAGFRRPQSGTYAFAATDRPARSRKDGWWRRRTTSGAGGSS